MTDGRTLTSVEVDDAPRRSSASAGFSANFGMREASERTNALSERPRVHGDLATAVKSGEISPGAGCFRLDRMAFGDQSMA